MLLAGYAAVVLLPILYDLIPNPVLFRWYWNNRNTAVPTDVQARAERVATRIPFVAQSILIAALWLMIDRSGAKLNDIGLITDGWQHGIGYGIAFASAWLALYAAMFATLKPDTSRRWDRRISLPHWVGLSLSSAVVEEIWRAFCLVALAAHGNAVAILMTAVAFGVAHPEPIGRAISATLIGLWMSWLFLWTRSVWPMMVAHYVVNIGVFCLIRVRWHKNPK